MSLNDKLIKTAIDKGLTCKFYGRRMHAVIGIPIILDSDHLRLYIKTSNNIVTLLLGDISAYEFPVEVTKDIELKMPVNMHACQYPQCDAIIPIKDKFCVTHGKEEFEKFKAEKKTK